MGHEAPFAMEDGYRPAPGMRRWLAGTPPVLGMAALETGVDLLLKADMAAVAAKSAALFDTMAAIGDALGLDCVSPRDPAARGSHISFRHPHAHQLCQALIAEGVIGDFRDPDILRLGLTPLYPGFEDVVRTGEILGAILAQERYLDPRFAVRQAVT
jgi:kynureninase